MKRQTISKFSKPVVELKNIEEFWDEYYKQKNQSKARSIYNKFKATKRFIEF
jgi:hypothetical protein